MGNLVWYLAYGSNLASSRFNCYITGGMPAGSGSDYKGCLDTTLPKETKNAVISHTLYFAKNSKTWQQGGVAFITPSETDSKTYARLYLITKEQLADIAMQETNSNERPELDFDFAERNGRHIFKSPSWYGLLLYLGEDSGMPIFTLTSTVQIEPKVKPSREYLATIMKGLIESHSLTLGQVYNYLSDKAGIGENYKHHELYDIVHNRYDPASE
ncbi:MAG: hypothetical protein DI588_12805 [Flavobacterium johnsoniae]|nr:MAG: hypothetical protein DI588_12805 [Flavobacterium johnsoniae]